MPDNLLSVRLEHIALIDADDLAGVTPQFGIGRCTVEYAGQPGCWWLIAGLCLRPSLLSFGFSCGHQLVYLRIGKFNP